MDIEEVYTMLYSMIMNSIEYMIDEISAGKNECEKSLSFNLIRDLNVPITIRARTIPALSQVEVELFCPFLLVDSSIQYKEFCKKDSQEDEVKIMRLVSRFSLTLEKLQSWIASNMPDIIRWSEGVVFDKNGRTKKIPFPESKNPKQTTKKRTRKKKDKGEIYE